MRGRRFRPLVVVALLVVARAHSCAQQEGLTTQSLLVAERPVLADAAPGALVVAGEPAANVVLPAEPSQELLFAALQLQTYVRKMSGAVLPVVAAGEEVTGNRVLLGPAAGLDAPDDLAAEGYLLRSVGRDLAVVGGGDLGTVFGVVEVLEHLGVRWYVPGDELGECVPQTADLALTGLDERHEPSFPMRWIGRATDWATMNRQNCEGTTLGAGFRIKPGIYHTQNALLPQREHFAEHPEWYALIDGERSAVGSCKLCYSNPEVARQVAAAMARLLDEDPGIDLVSFSPTDGQMWCECDACRALDEEDVPKDQAMSRRSLLFYNAIAAELRKTHPEAKMLVGAYNVYNWPPADPSLKADPMLSVIITHYQDYCMAHPVADPSCPRNQRYVEVIEAWDALGTPVYYYEYYWKVNWMDLPWPIVHCLKQDLPWMHARGDRGVFSQFNRQNAWTLYPAYYIAARLLWDVDADVDAIFDEMCDRLYGAGGPAIREYYRLMEDAMAATEEHYPGGGTSYGARLFGDDLLAAMGEQLRRAHELAAGDELAQRRLAKLDLSYQYASRLTGYVRARNAMKTRAEGEQVIAMLEALVNEVREDREKWDGVVSTSVVAQPVYLGKELSWLREKVAGME